MSEVILMPELRLYYKLSFGPDYIGWFDNAGAAQLSISRLCIQLEEDGIIRYADKAKLILAEKPPYTMQIDALEMTEAEFLAEKAKNSDWANEK